MTDIIAIDLETTGLNPEKDSIIEIAAVRFKDGEVIDEWSTLINPDRTIPQLITSLTGITNSMVVNAPSIYGVLEELIEFLGSSTLVGHNVGFDLAFLRNFGVAENNIAVDTYEFASILLPAASRYNLGALCQQLEVPLDEAHRALEDARATGFLFFNLLERADQLPTNLVAALVRLSEPFDWGAYWPLQQILKQRVRQTFVDNVGNLQYGPVFNDDGNIFLPPLEPVEEKKPLYLDEVLSVLEYGGPFSQYFPNYEFRAEQQRMLEAVTLALSNSQHLMVEAGTGTGKSFAYLIPAAFWALQNKERVVVSTNTINLQDQLIKKDIPDLCKALDLDLRAVVLKGRSNYLCPRRLELMGKSRPPTTVTEMRVFAKIMIWLLQNGKGDRNDINLHGPTERTVWSQLSADFEGCDFDDCPRILANGSCPYYQAHQTSQSAHILVINHALLLADIATGNRVLPHFDYLIADEAHHIEDASTNALSFSVSEVDIRIYLRELGSKRSGILHRVLNTTVPLVSPQQYATIDNLIQRCTDLAFRLENDFKNLFISFDEFLIEVRDGRPVGNYVQQVRIIPATRTQPSWTEIEIIWDQTSDTLNLLLNLLQQLHKEVSSIRKHYQQEMEEIFTSLGFIITSLSEIFQNVSQIILESQMDQIYWVENNPQSRSNLSLHLAPLHVGPLMQEHIWHKKESVILTSATLTANEDFDYIRNRLFADEADALVLGSPFDYENAALLYIVNDIPEPQNNNQYLRAIATAIVTTAASIGGNILVLFTSYAALRAVSDNITPILNKHNIQVFTQGQGASPNSLVESFRSTERSVLLGTRSFWEGVDIPGADLSCVMITKLPFDVPSDPIIAARSETYESPFGEYSLPEAILKFRQGFGRLIRTQTDRGIVVVLDRRVLTKQYGRAFIDSLPSCKKTVSSLADLPAIAARWLNL